ncbi:hypothetical protein ACFQ8C_33075 [Streptomyces sp. NPDC056503]|uniref:hypothetical protein n=1 Tax=Streptomyces sp. NPDC056503 TaxID=3345842 RepID=UPI0036AF9132
MDAQRTVYIKPDQPVGGSGSGYLIGPRLVLTALHVVHDDGIRAEGATVWVGHPRTDTGVHQRTATVIWPATDAGPDSPDVPDVALLYLDSAADEGHTSAVRWGQPQGAGPLAYSGIGIPAFSTTPGGAVQYESLRGELAPLTTASRRWVLDCKVWPAAARQKERPWAGASGAAIFSGGHLVGVAVEYGTGMGERRLTAEPVHRLLDDPGFTAVLAEYGFPGTRHSAGVITAPAGEATGVVWPRQFGTVPGLAPSDSPVPSCSSDGAVPAVSAHLIPSAPAPVVATVPRFSGVPARVAQFLGREEELHRLKAAVYEDRAAVVTQVVHGLGGVGKTATATEFCHRYRSDFAVVRWIPAHSREVAVENLLSYASLLGIPTVGVAPADVVQLAYQILAEHPGQVLLVFDNVDQPGWLEPLLPTESGISVIVTSRYQGWDAEGLRTIALDTFSLDESVDLLLAVAGNNDRDGAVELAGHLGGLALALRQAGAYCRRQRMGFGAYGEALQENAAELYARNPARIQRGLGLDADFTIRAVLETSLAQAGREGPLATVLLHVSAHLPATGISTELFLAPNAVNEELLRFGDELAVRESLAALERLWLLEPTETSDEGVTTFNVHRVIQHLCRTMSGEHRGLYAELAVRLVRRGGFGWEYTLSPGGELVVCLERGSGRLLAHHTARSATSSELLLPYGAADVPLSVVAEAEAVQATYSDRTVRWRLGDGGTVAGREAVPGTTVPTTADEGRPVCRLTDPRPFVTASSEENGEEHLVRLPNGDVLRLAWYGAGFFRVMRDGHPDVALDPGWYSRRTVEAPPIVDPTGQWLVISMETTKHVDHGWLAAVRIADLWDKAENRSDTEAETCEEDEDRSVVRARELHPNGRPYEELDDESEVDPADENRGGATYHSVTDMCFSLAGDRLYLIDRASIHCWSWPDFAFQWRIRRPELCVTVRSIPLGRRVVQAVSVRSSGYDRLVLDDGEIMDLRQDDLWKSRRGIVEHALAVSPMDGSVLTAGGICTPSRETIAAFAPEPPITSATGLGDGGFLCLDARGILLRLDGTGIVQVSADTGRPGARFLAAHSSGLVFALTDDRSVVTEYVLDGGELRPVSEWNPHKEGPFDHQFDAKTLREFRSQRAVTAAAFMTPHDMVEGMGNGEIRFPEWYLYRRGTPVTALAAEADTVIAGFANGHVLAYADRSLYSAKLFPVGVSHVLPRIGSRRFTAISEGGDVAVVTWH